MTGSSYESYLSAPGPTVLLSLLSLEGFSQTTLLLKKKALGIPALFLRLCNPIPQIQEAKLSSIRLHDS